MKKFLVFIIVLLSVWFNMRSLFGFEQPNFTNSWFSQNPENSLQKAFGVYNAFAGSQEKKITSNSNIEVETENMVASVMQPIQMKFSKKISDKCITIDEILIQFRAGKSFHETTMQCLLNLLSQEIIVVDCLLLGKSPSTVQEALCERERMMRYSCPTVRNLYEDIMNIATSDLALQSCGCSTRYIKLNWSEKSAYLCKLKNTLGSTYDKVEDLQMNFIIN